MIPRTPKLHQRSTWNYPAEILVHHHANILTIIYTMVGTAPGFCTRRALTTWNTSTTPSVLHLSMVVAMAQNIPLRVTVSLQWTTMGLLPDLIWTLVISSITSMILFRLEHWPLGFQLVICNWVTSLAFRVCDNRYGNGRQNIVSLFLCTLISMTERFLITNSSSGFSSISSTV